MTVHAKDHGSGVGAHTLAMPVLAVLLGLCVIALVAIYTTLSWQRRVALESERGANIAALAESRVNETVGSVTASLHMMANRLAWTGDWVTGLTRAAQAGGRVGSVSLLSATGEVEASTAERNVGLRLEPGEFGGGWTTARFGVGGFFQGRDLFDRRPTTGRADADFVVISVPSSDGGAFAVATLSLRSLHVSLMPFLTDLRALGIGIYWPNGDLIHAVGSRTMPPTLPAATLGAIAATDRYADPDILLAWSESSRLACQSSTSDPFIVCSVQTLSSLPREWLGWRGAALVLLLMADVVLVAGALRIAAERRQREAEREALRLSVSRSDRRQRVALESATGLVWECDGALTSIRYFGNVRRLLGPDAPDLEPVSAFLKRLRPQDASRLTETVSAWPGSDQTDLSALVQLAEPSSKWLRISGRWEAGSELSLVGTMDDVTALLETTERYRAIFREVAQPILLLDGNGSIEEVNPAAEIAFGQRPGALQGLDVGDLIRRGGAKAERATLGDIGPGDLTGVRADGTTFPLGAATGTWLVDGHYKIVAILRDLSVEKEIAQRQLDARLAADRASQAKSEFLSTMSHEIRTPLNGVIGTADLLSRTRLDREQTQYVTVLRDSADHLLQLINDILDLSRLDSARIDLEEVPFDVADLIRGAVDILEPRATAKGLSLSSWVMLGVPPRLVGDVGRIRQVLLNLVGNAIKFTETGSVTLEVSGSNPICFAVRDSGIGIPPDQIDRLFGKFVQLDGSIGRRFGGSGLGLAISNRLAMRMGGRIEVTSALDIGSVFTLTLPLKAASGPSIEETEDVIEAAPECLDILVAEDSRTNQLIVRRILESMGHSVRVVCDGADAVEAILARRADIVLMDVMMPRMDGLAATRAIRAIDRFATLPIVAVTAGAFAHDHEACTAAGMSGFVTKPINRPMLKAAIADALAWRIRQQEATASPENDLEQDAFV